MNGIRLSGIRKVFDTDDGRLEVLKELNLFCSREKNYSSAWQERMRKDNDFTSYCRT